MQTRTCVNSHRVAARGEEGVTAGSRNGPAAGIHRLWDRTQTRVYRNDVRVALYAWWPCMEMVAMCSFGNTLWRRKHEVPPGEHPA